MKPTPGPWWIEWPSRGPLQIRGALDGDVDDDGQRTVSAELIAEINANEDDEANAYLIATAWEMREVLRKARNQVVAFALDTLSAEVAIKQVAYIDAILAKSEGQ